MVGNFTYDNWTQARIKIEDAWVEGIIYQDCFISLKGEVTRLDQIDDDDIIEHNWRELCYKETN